MPSRYKVWKSLFVKSPNLTPCHFFLWVCAKEQVYKPPYKFSEHFTILNFKVYKCLNTWAYNENHGRCPENCTQLYWTYWTLYWNVIYWYSVLCNAIKHTYCKIKILSVSYKPSFKEELATYTTLQNRDFSCDPTITSKAFNRSKLKQMCHVCVCGFHCVQPSL